ncbi:MAG: hypothetical protein AAF481_00485 [Acidobacteriota bacterium]
MRARERFVFAVCGEATYLEQMERAVAHLQRFADREVVVVTDAGRNQRPVVAGEGVAEVIDVATPEALDHRQASIWLKTSLPRHLDASYRYCYLDADVLAVKKGVEQVFLYDFGPAVFASDHCRLDDFSPCAVDCGCWNADKERRARQLDGLIQSFERVDPEVWPLRRRVEEALERHDDRYRQPPPEIGWRRDQLRAYLDRLGDRPVALAWGMLTRVLRRIGARQTWELWRHRDPDRVIDAHLGPVTERIRRDLDVHWHEEERHWLDRQGRVVLRDVPWHVERTSPFRYDAERDLWLDAAGEAVFHRRCDHLRQAIGERFRVDIPDGDWRHWNGGVILFGPEAAPFFERWHRMTLDIFDDPHWLDRDQGTLVAAVWSLGLEEQSTLPMEFNFLADYQRPDLEFSPREGFSLGGEERWIEPFLVHVYHHWGDDDWLVWRWLDERLEGPP